MTPHGARLSRLMRAAQQLCVLLGLAFPAGQVAARQAPAPTPAAAARSFDQALRDNDFIPLAPPLAAFEAGGIVEPGAERFGTYFKDETLEILGKPEFEENPNSISDRLKLDPPVGLGTFEELRARIPDLSAAPVAADNRCLRQPIEAKRIVERGFSAYKSGAGSEEPFRKMLVRKLDGRVEVSEEDFETYVIVTSTVSPAVEVKDCDADKDRREIKEAVGSLVWGYSAATPDPGRSGGGVGWMSEGRRLFGLIFRRPFELIAPATNAGVLLEPVVIVPDGAHLGYRKKWEVSGKQPNQLRDDDFIPPANPRSFRINPGVYYFRLTQDGRRSTQEKDITVRTRSLELRFEHGVIH